MEWSTHEVLSLRSERIEDFLNRRMPSRDPDHAKAVDFFKKIQLMMDDGNWVITTRRADYRALNRTGGTIRSIGATVDFFADDVLFYVADMKRTFIEADRQFEFREEILKRVYEVAGVLRDEYGQPRGLKNTPQLRCGFREYTLEISDKHRMFNNEYVRAVAGLVPMRRDCPEFEEFTACAAALPKDLKARAERIADSLRHMMEDPEGDRKGGPRSDQKGGFRNDRKGGPRNDPMGDPQTAVQVEGFISRYLPTVSRAISNYCSHPDDEKARTLAHTMEVMTIAAENMKRSISGSEDDLSSIEQKILEQQLIREGLYSPFVNLGPARGGNPDPEA